MSEQLTQPEQRAIATSTHSHRATRTQRPKASNGLILAIVCLGQFMVVLDVSIVNVALPAIGRDLHYSSTGLQWVVNGYVLTFAGFLLLGGRLADLFGQRRIFLAGLGLFSLASLLGGLAQNSGELTAARALQGLGGAVLSPATLTIITTTFTDMPGDDTIVEQPTDGVEFDAPGVLDPKAVSDADVFAKDDVSLGVQLEPTELFGRLTGTQDLRLPAIGPHELGKVLLGRDPRVRSHLALRHRRHDRERGRRGPRTQVALRPPEQRRELEPARLQSRRHVPRTMYDERQ